MANEKWRMDLKGDIRTALDRNSEYDLPELVTVALLAAVLPHLEAAYKRGEMAGSSRIGYKIPKPRKEEQ
jgi:hypothetical protein